jgi:starvation-inducible outer membrane lipoprotein
LKGTRPLRKKIIIAGIFLILLFLFSGCQKATQNIQQSAQLSADDSKLIHSIDDIQDKRIGVLLGSIHDAYATKNYPHATVMQYKSCQISFWQSKPANRLCVHHSGDLSGSDEAG